MRHLLDLAALQLSDGHEAKVDWPLRRTRVIRRTLRSPGDWCLHCSLLLDFLPFLRALPCGPAFLEAKVHHLRRGSVYTPQLSMVGAAYLVSDYLPSVLLPVLVRLAQSTQIFGLPLPVSFS